MFFSADNYFLKVNPQFAEQPMAKMLLLAATLAVDIVYAILDPRIRLSG